MQINTNNYKNFEVNETPIRKLKRCTCCVLPETMPFIEFDDKGVCNYCKSYKKHELKPHAELEKLAAGIRRTDGKPDSVVSFSGGRDSSYGLHYFVKELGLKPLAYCYDWGMGTELSFRNQKRMCEALNVELVTVKANIAKKRSNIKKNITAWLKNPDIGLIPIFMAGDKQFFYYANKTKKEYGVSDILMASNPFERTLFKTGFCGVKPKELQTSDSSSEEQSAVEKLHMSGVMKLTGYYIKQYITNPSYINSSLADTIRATASNYFIPHDYLRLYDYVSWNEDEINNVLLNEYNWEKATDTDSTWRIGDGTAPFYNYIYYLIAGLTENDTMRSNQIREGMLTRDKALELIYRDNKPRFESMQWYFNVIDMDMEMVLKRVNKIPKLYNT